MYYYTFTTTKIKDTNYKIKFVNVISQEKLSHFINIVKLLKTIKNF